MKKLHIAFSVIMIGLAIFFFFYADTFRTLPGQTDIGPRAFPKVICVLLVICVIIMLVQELRKKEDEKPELFSVKWLIGVVTAFGFYFVLPHLGFVFSAMIAIIIMEILLLNEPFKQAARVAIPVAIIVPVVIQLVFGQLLKVPLPAGILSGLLG